MLSARGSRPGSSFVFSSSEGLCRAAGNAGPSQAEPSKRMRWPYMAETARPRVVCSAAVTGKGTAKAPQKLNELRDLERVRDVMTAGNIVSVTPETTVDAALELLVDHKITGLPVVDSDTGCVVGVVSDFDLLALDEISGKALGSKGMFPDVKTEWSTFRAVQRLIMKNAGKTVGDVMTAEPLTITAGSSVEEAARILLTKKVRRLPVVSASGQLEGIITRGNIIAAALAMRRRAKASLDRECGDIISTLESVALSSIENASLPNGWKP